MRRVTFGRLLYSCGPDTERNGAPNLILFVFIDLEETAKSTEYD